MKGLVNIINKYIQCTCIGTYYGVGCEIEGCTTVRNGKDCVNSCPTGYYTNTNINYCIGCPGVFIYNY